MSMPQGYCLLKGDPQHGAVKFNSKNIPHYQIANADGTQIAMNIESEDGSEIIYQVMPNFAPPNADALQALNMGITHVANEPGGLALDYIRGNLGVDPAQMIPLPIGIGAEHPENPLRTDLVQLLNRAINDERGTVYGFGFEFGSEFHGQLGLHKTHMNQGNPPDSPFAQGDGPWQDGALLIELPSENTWLAVFVAFQTQSFALAAGA